MGRARPMNAGGLTAFRDQNARKVLEALLERPEGATQLEIARETGLGRSTVSNLLSESLSSVLVSEEREEGMRGPPPQVWSVDPEAAFAVGLDIGKSHIGVALTDPYGRIVGQPKFKQMDNTLDDPNRTLDAAASLLEVVVADPAKCRRIAAVMVGLPGATNAEHGLLVDPAAPAWSEFDVPEQVKQRWPYPNAPRVYVENDANLGALGELYEGAGRSVNSLLFIKWSSGIGSGLILDGKLWRGKSGIAGELGHLAVRPTKADRAALGLQARGELSPCPRCNQRDCIERIAGGPALAQAIGVEDFRAVIRQAYDRDPEKQLQARMALAAAAKLIGTAIGPTLAMLNVELVAFGGIGGTDAFHLAITHLEQGIEQTATPQARDDATVQASELGQLAYVLGASIAAFKKRGVKFLIQSGISAESVEKGAILAG